MEMALLNCSETTGPSTTTTLETLTTFVRSIKFPSRRLANSSWRSTRRCRFRRSQSVVFHSLFVMHKNPAKWQEVSEIRHIKANTKRVSLHLANEQLDNWATSMFFENNSQRNPKKMFSKLKINSKNNTDDNDSV